MFTLHLSRFLKGPPNQSVQQLNAFIHQEPYDVVAYCLYWMLVLGFLAPVVAMSLPFFLCYQLARQHFLKDQQIILPTDPHTGEGAKTQLAVVVTGCDSGIGKELAVCLASEGFVVFAGCLQKESFDHFSGMESSIHPVVVDVTSEEQIQACHQVVNQWLEDAGGSNEKRFLHALVNNAGVGVAGYVDWLDISDFEVCMNVNCFGVIRMTKTFLPTLKKQAISGEYKDSQIVNIVSVSGMTSGGGLAASTYEASKHAVEAFTNALRLELKMFGISVVALNPCFFDTPLTNGVQERFREQLSKKIAPKVKEEYGEAFIENYVEHCDRMINAGKWELKVLIDSVVKVVKSKDPPAQLMIGMDRYMHATFNMLPQWARHWVVQLGMPPQTPAILKKKS